MDLMEKNTNRMLNLVNQILDFRKIQNGKMRLHVSQINLNEMLESFQKSFGSCRRKMRSLILFLFPMNLFWYGAIKRN